MDLLDFVDDAVPLTDIVAQDVPKAPGVHAQWFGNPAGLREAGIAGPAPVLLYVGTATNLADRFANRRHLLDFRLHELLATRGTLHWMWGHRVPRLPSEPSRINPSDLDWLALDEAVKWQQEHTVWAWSRCRTPDHAKRVETELIRSGDPMLNITSSPSREQPPQLRRAQRYPSARARWLWQVSWAAALFTTRAHYSRDELGYPRLDPRANDRRPARLSSSAPTRIERSRPRGPRRRGPST